MRVCCWKSQFESMAQDFGDQAFRDCWLFSRIFPPPAASFHLPIIWLAISDVTRITQACQCLYPLCSVAPSLVLPVGHWQADLIRSSLAILHQPSLCIFQPLHQQSIWAPPIKTMFFYRNLVIRQLIHSFASWREFPGSFPGIPSKLLFPPLPSFIRNSSSNQKSQFFKDVWLVTSWSTWPGKIGSICTRTWDDQAC